MHDPVGLVRFAMSAHLEAWPGRTGARGRTGRQAFASALGINDTRLSALVAGGGQPLADLADQLEQHRFAPHESVVRLVEQVLLVPNPRPTLGRRWWPVLREEFVLGDPDAAPRCSTPVAVVGAAEALVAHYDHVVADVAAATREMTAQDLLAAQQLLGLLCRLASGPSGVAYDALRLAARLTPLHPNVVIEHIQRGGPRTQLVRALERSVRRTRWQANDRRELASLLASPPERIVRRVYWIRALRRIRMSDFSSPARSDLSRDWVTNQLIVALRGERAYEGARPTDRRCALWAAAEVTLDDAKWRHVERAAQGDDLLEQLVPVARQLREHLGRVSLPQRDGFWFTPEDGWPDLSSDTAVREILDVSMTRSSSWSQAAAWRWAKPSTRITGAALVRDTLLAPCAVRQRSAVEALIAAGLECQDAAVSMVSDVLAAETAATRPHPVVLQRALVVLGMMRRPGGIDAVEEVLKHASSIDQQLIAQAIASAGDLASRWPERSVGLRAWALTRAKEHAHDSDVASTAVHACIAMGTNPAELGPLPETPSVHLTLDWAKEVLEDPLYQRR